jgi:hypothetical protein
MGAGEARTNRAGGHLALLPDYLRGRMRGSEGVRWLCVQVGGTRGRRWRDA